MKKEIILYKFEWCKNRTTMIFFVSMIFLFLFCLWIVADCCIEKYSYSAPSIFVSDFKTSYEKAKTIYEENPTFENLLTLNRSIAIYEMQKKVIESGRDLNKNCYYCQGLEHDFLLAIKKLIWKKKVFIWLS